MSDFVADHLRRYLATNGADGYLLDMVPHGGQGTAPCLLLTTTGRKSGLDFTLPLIFGEANGGYVIVASRGGAPAHPAWYLNLVAQPTVTVQIRERVFRARARTAAGAERATLWRMMAGVFPPYEDYQRKTEREIPVVVLDPLAD